MDINALINAFAISINPKNSAELKEAESFLEFVKIK